MKEVISKAIGRQVFCSSGFPTIECELQTKNHSAFSSAPRGISKSSFEAIEKTDSLNAFNGKSVFKNIEIIQKEIFPKIKNLDPNQQSKIDNILIKLDGTRQKEKLGANTMLAVSQANCKLSAIVSKKECFQIVQKLANTKKLSMPIPIFNLIEGGKHAINSTGIQEYWIIPSNAKNFEEAMRIGVESYLLLKKKIIQKYGKQFAQNSEEGGFALPIKTTLEAASLLQQVLDENHFEKKAFLGIDAAAANFAKQESYLFEEKELNYGEMIEVYEELAKEHNIIAIEDPFRETAMNEWKELAKAIGKKAMIIGDDLTATNSQRLKEAVREKAVNSVIIKPNQIGTITEAIEFSNNAKKEQIQRIVSHRASETIDSFIADFCIGTGAEYCKFGAPSRERIAKYNRLIQIDSKIGKAD